MVDLPLSLADRARPLLSDGLTRFRSWVVHLPVPRADTASGSCLQRTWPLIFDGFTRSGEKMQEPSECDALHTCARHGHGNVLHGKPECGLDGLRLRGNRCFFAANLLTSLLKASSHRIARFNTCQEHLRLVELAVSHRSLCSDCRPHEDVPPAAVVSIVASPAG